MVTSDNIPLLIHAQTTVSIAIVSKPNVQTFLDNKLLKPFNVGRACIGVDVGAIWLIVDNICIRTKCVKNRLCNTPRTTICTVQTDLDTLEGINT